ncbi:MAG: OmpA family protein [Marinibacterium sp.]
MTVKTPLRQTALWARAICLIVGLAVGLAAAGQVAAQSGLFDQGWTLDPEASSLSFQSIKATTKAENSSFASLEGTIDETGAARIVVFLESVDTKIDLRNVRMRFLFFETFQFPEAVISAQLDPSALSDLAQVREKVLPLPYVLEIHGASKGYESKVLINLLDANRVSVSTVEPISISVQDFGMMDGLAKLEEAAGVPIIPSATVAFNFVFSRNGSPGKAELVAASAPAAGASRALETSGDFGLQECNNRFETLSKSGGIFFAPGSARLDAASAPLLRSLAEIINRCPGLTIEVAGHTDSIGGADANQRLSERRAISVTDYLARIGVSGNRVRAAGYGEARPVATNATAQGRARNRRIEFTILGG